MAANWTPAVGPGDRGQSDEANQAKPDAGPSQLETVFFFFFFFFFFFSFIFIFSPLPLLLLLFFILFLLSFSSPPPPLSTFFAVQFSHRRLPSSSRHQRTSDDDTFLEEQTPIFPFFFVRYKKSINHPRERERETERRPTRKFKEAAEPPTDDRQIREILPRSTNRKPLNRPHHD